MSREIDPVETARPAARKPMSKRKFAFLIAVCAMVVLAAPVVFYKLYEYYLIEKVIRPMNEVKR